MEGDFSNSPVLAAAKQWRALDFVFYVSMYGIGENLYSYEPYNTTVMVFG